MQLIVNPSAEHLGLRGREGTNQADQSRPVGVPALAALMALPRGSREVMVALVDGPVDVGHPELTSEHIVEMPGRLRGRRLAQSRLSATGQATRPYGALIRSRRCLGSIRPHTPDPVDYMQASSAIKPTWSATAPGHPFDRRQPEPGKITHKGGRRPSRVTRSALVRDLARLHTGAPGGWPPLQFARMAQIVAAPDRCGGPRGRYSAPTPPWPGGPKSGRRRPTHKVTLAGRSGDRLGPAPPG
jgi:hypothetical protein